MKIAVMQVDICIPGGLVSSSAFHKLFMLTEFYSSAVS